MTLKFPCFVASSEAPLARQPQPFGEIDSAVFETRAAVPLSRIFRFGAEDLSSSFSGRIGPENSDLRAMKATRDDCAKLPE